MIHPFQHTNPIEGSVLDFEFRSYNEFSRAKDSHAKLQWNPASWLTSLLRPLYSDPNKSSVGHFFLYSTVHLKKQSVILNIRLFRLQKFNRTFSHLSDALRLPNPLSTYLSNKVYLLTLYSSCSPSSRPTSRLTWGVTRASEKERRVYAPRACATRTSACWSREN